MGRNGENHGGPDLVERLEKELALVDAALDDALAAAP
jgi:hypothetical protein